MNNFKEYFYQYLNSFILEEAAVYGADQPVQQVIFNIIASVTALYKWLAPLAEKQPWLEVDSTKVPTMATDGINFYYNADFIRQIIKEKEATSPGEAMKDLTFIILHEIMHNSLGHFARSAQPGVDNELWNIATDLEINHLIEDMTTSRGNRLTIPQGTLGTDEFYSQNPDLKQFQGRAAEVIYNYISKDPSKYKKEPPSQSKPDIDCPFGKGVCPYSDKNIVNKLQPLYNRAGELINFPCPYEIDIYNFNVNDFISQSKALKDQGLLPIDPSIAQQAQQSKNLKDLLPDELKHYCPINPKDVEVQDGDGIEGVGKIFPVPQSTMPKKQQGSGDSGQGDSGKSIGQSGPSTLDPSKVSGDSFKGKVSDGGKVLAPGEISKDEVKGEEAKDVFEKRTKGLSPSEIEEKKKEWQDSFKKQAVDHGVASGNTNLGRYMRQQLFPPTQNWRRILKQFLKKGLDKSSNVWLKRKFYSSTGEYAKRRKVSKSMIKTLVLAIDTSGSVVGIPELLDLFMNEITHAISTYDVSEAWILYADADVYPVRFSKKELKNFKVNKSLLKERLNKQAKGGGGTSFVPPFQFVKVNKIKPDAFIYVTDGMGDFPSSDLVNFPTLWIIGNDFDRTVDESFPPGIGSKVDVFINKDEQNESFIVNILNNKFSEILNEIN